MSRTRRRKQAIDSPTNHKTDVRTRSATVTLKDVDVVRQACCATELALDVLVSINGDVVYPTRPGSSDQHPTATIDWTIESSRPLGERRLPYTKLDHSNRRRGDALDR